MLSYIKKVFFFCIILCSIGGISISYAKDMNIKLPPPRLKGEVSLEETLYERQSIRHYAKDALPLEKVSQLLWAAQGKAAHGNRTAPSAGATYPIELYLVAGEVENLAPGVYHYIHKSHSLELVQKGDIREELADACLGQSMIANAQVSLIIDAVHERTAGRYGQKATRYIRMEAGHVGQNIYLQATALGLGTVAVGAFYDSTVKDLIPELEFPLCVFPVGKQ